MVRLKEDCRASASDGRVTVPGHRVPGRGGRCAADDGVVWDPTRKVMWLFSRTGWRDKDPQVFAYNLDTNEMKAMSPINRATLGQKAGYLRETVYLPGADLVLTLAFDRASKRQIAYDPAKNRWVLVNIQSVGRVGSPMAMVYDTKRDLFWCLTGGRLTYALRVDPKTLESAEE